MSQMSRNVPRGKSSHLRDLVETGIAWSGPELTPVDIRRPELTAKAVERTNPPMRIASVIIATQHEGGLDGLLTTNRSHPVHRGCWIFLLPHAAGAGGGIGGKMESESRAG